MNPEGAIGYQLMAILAMALLAVAIGYWLYWLLALVWLLAIGLRLLATGYWPPPDPHPYGPKRVVVNLRNCGGFVFNRLQQQSPQKHRFTVSVKLWTPYFQPFTAKELHVKVSVKLLT